MFKIKTWYYLHLLTAETMKVLGSTKSKTTKNENGENVPNLEITEVVLVYCNIVNSNYQQNFWLSESLVYIYFKYFIGSVIRHFTWQVYFFKSS